MLSYKEYKLLNESLYGAFNLGLRTPNTVAGVVSASSINGTEAALEAQAEEAIEEAKKMKKKMEDEDEEDREDMEDMEDMEDSDEDSDEDEDSEDDEDEDSEDDEDEESEEEAPKFKFMKKRAKKEWAEVFADLETVLEGIEDEESSYEIKKGMAILKEGLKKGLKGHKKGCDCKFCKNIKSKEDSKDSSKEDSKEGSDSGSKKKNGHDKDCDCKMCKMMLKKCGSGKMMKKEEKEWWDSVNGMLGSEINQKNWDGVWSEVGEVQQAVRENANAGGEYVIEIVFKDGRKERVTDSNYEKIRSQYQMLSQNPEMSQITIFNTEGQALASTNTNSVARRNAGVVG